MAESLVTMVTLKRLVSSMDTNMLLQTFTVLPAIKIDIKGNKLTFK